ncbi:DUF4383 domain-containing protein [Actinoalloteichus hymeniacidonis]|uniref:DUF4383 domain-containing protein n=1 Tax=Actinoalloteichus hymeniacidonis TaxID=340345 RepID=A0AAC9N0N5_9PSEU|nr:DUF4383 domain-containing protein [Actinoalloteichus hymeniacidonis]AOS65086.1 hypothetical protein TL08_21495 [Actinoalloteichus hymeniacidonis]MBB5906835.1 hypothetical protein [Actinoalloteichus hymeniacidonis]
MRMNQYLRAGSPLSTVYRVGAGLIGAGLILFGLLALIARVQFFSTEGQPVLGMSSNGLLAVISLVVGAILIGSALIGGVVASTTAIVIGVLFLVSGMANLAVIRTPLNVFAFTLPNVVFSLVVGMLLLFLGLYGRLSGGLPEDNPFVRARHHEDPRDDHSHLHPADRRRLAEIEPLARAEHAVAEGEATPEQERLVADDAERRAQQRQQEAWRNYERDQRDEAVPTQQGGSQADARSDTQADGEVPTQQNEPGQAAPREQRSGRSDRRGGPGRHRRPPTIRA